MDLQAIKALRELNFNKLFKLKANLDAYSYELYEKNGNKHPLCGMCTICEDDKVNVCPSDSNFKLMAMGHGSTSDDILEAARLLKMDFSLWKEQGVMFVFENPGTCFSRIYEKIDFNGYSKYPCYKWFWSHNPPEKCEYPKHFDGNKYDEFIASAMFTFKLKNLYITDIIKCGMNASIDKGYKNTINKKGEFVDYNKKCIDNCFVNYFYKEIQIIKPKIIFCFGKEAEAIINIYKREIEKHLHYSISVIYLPHPARQGLSKADFQQMYYDGLISGLFGVGIISEIEKQDYLKKAIKNDNEKLLSKKSNNENVCDNQKTSDNNSRDDPHGTLIKLKESISCYDNIKGPDRGWISSIRNGKKFYVKLEGDDFRFHWEDKKNNNMDHFKKLCNAVNEISESTKLFPKAELNPSDEKIKRLIIYVKRENFIETIKNILKETVGIVGYIE